jgi:hypothetical protein
MASFQPAARAVDYVAGKAGGSLWRSAGCLISNFATPRQVKNASNADDETKCRQGRMPTSLMP